MNWGINAVVMDIMGYLLGKDYFECVISEHAIAIGLMNLITV